MVRKRKLTVTPIAWKKSLVMWLLVVATGTVVALVIAATVLRSWTGATIDSFDECKAAGGAIAESYPEQCFIYGKSFMNDVQLQNGSDYVGLSEDAAMEKAKEADVPSRVVERDGESLPVTADYAVGRLNFYVKDGDVYKVDVEGEE